LRMSDWSSDVCSSDLNALELGRLQAATGDFDGARNSFGQATQLDPARFDAWFLLGVTYMREERQAQALPFLRQAHQLRPTRPDATRALADAEFHAGTAGDALPLWREVVAAGPGAVNADRKSGGSGTGGLVRVGFGGRRSIKKKN